MPGPDLAGLREWWLARDPHAIGLARGVRAAVAAPVAFAFALEVLDEPVVALMAAFSAIACLVFADFGGSARARTVAYVDVGWIGAALLALGTAVSTTEWAAIGLTLVVAAIVRFVGNLGPRANAAISPLVLGFVLGVLVPAPVAEILPRVAGWALGVLLAILTTAVIRPARTSEHLDRTVAAGARVAATALRAVGSGTAPAAELAGDLARVHADLRRVLVMPLRPSGPGRHATARRVVTDRLLRLVVILEAAIASPPVALSPEMRAFGAADADLLEAAAEVLDGTAGPEALLGCFRARQEARDAAYGRLVALVGRGDPTDHVMDRVDAGFAVRAGGLHAEAFAHGVCVLRDAEAVAAAAGVTDASGVDGTLQGTTRRTRRLLGAHAGSTSVWFRDAARAGVALALAVAISDAFVREHAFWVALGTLSVLRSSALATGQTAVGAAVGTGVGFALSSLVFAVIGLDPAWLWVLLVVAILGVGALPPVTGFASGQAAFTVAVVVLFNLLEPQGWRTGLVRLENVALGAAVATGVALLFWPRRLEPLVRRLTGELGTAAGAHLVGEVRARSRREPAPAAAGRAVAEAEDRARVALAELTTQYRHAPATTAAWVGRVAVDTHARSIADAVARIRLRFPEGATPTALDPVLEATAATLAADLAAASGPPPRSRRATADAELRGAAEAALADAPTRPDAVVSGLFTRDWLLTLAGMVDDRP